MNITCRWLQYKLRYVFCSRNKVSNLLTTVEANQMPIRCITPTVHFCIFFSFGENILRQVLEINHNIIYTEIRSAYYTYINFQMVVSCSYTILNTPSWYNLELFCLLPHWMDLNMNIHKNMFPLTTAYRPINKCWYFARPPKFLLNMIFIWKIDQYERAFGRRFWKRHCYNIT